MWESSRIGDFYIDKLNLFDQVIVPNRWNKETFENFNQIENFNQLEHFNNNLDYIYYYSIKSD